MGTLGLFIGIIVGVSLLPFALKKILSQTNFTKGFQRIIYVISVVLFFILLSELILNNFNLYYRGYKTRTFIIMATGLFFSLSFIITKFNRSLYLMISGFLVFLSVFVCVSICTINLIGFSDNLLFDDGKYRIESFRFLNSGDNSLPSLFRKEFLFEKKYQLTLIGEPTEQILESSVANGFLNECLITESDDSIYVNFVLNNQLIIKTGTEK